MSSTQESEKVHLQVQVLYNGAVLSFPYHPHERVEHLLKKAREAFGITANPHLMGLFNLGGQELADAESLSEADVSTDDELILRQSVVRGG